MNLKAKTAADPRLSRIVHGPSNLTKVEEIAINDDNKSKFVADWGTFSQSLLWIMQNSSDSSAVTVAMNALRESEMLRLKMEYADGEDV